MNLGVIRAIPLCRHPVARHLAAAPTVRYTRKLALACSDSCLGVLSNAQHPGLSRRACQGRPPVAVHNWTLLTIGTSDPPMNKPCHILLPGDFGAICLASASDKFCMDAKHSGTVAGKRHTVSECTRDGHTLSANQVQHTQVLTCNNRLAGQLER